MRCLIFGCCLGGSWDCRFFDVGVKRLGVDSAISEIEVEGRSLSLELKLTICICIQ